jgi:hypothetical protein
VAIIVTAALRSGATAYDRSNSVLLSQQNHLSDAVLVAGLNYAWLAAITLLAWPIARLWSWDIHDTWDHAVVNAAARVVYPIVAVCLLLGLWWIFSAQARALDERLISHWALFATLPHGTPEFSALLLPLAAAASCIFAPAERPGRLLLRTVAVSVPLVLIAALVEVYLTPQLLIPLQV